MQWSIHDFPDEGLEHFLAQKLNEIEKKWIASFRSVARYTIKAWCFERHVDTWVYSKDDTMAHTCRLMVIS